MSARGLPPGESLERNVVCHALTEALLYLGALAGEAGERTTVDLENREEVRALARLLTTRDGEGRDGALGENTKRLWERIAEMVAPGEPR